MKNYEGLLAHLTRDDARPGVLIGFHLEVGVHFGRLLPADKDEVYPCPRLVADEKGGMRLDPSQGHELRGYLRGRLKRCNDGIWAVEYATVDGDTVDVYLDWSTVSEIHVGNAHKKKVIE